MVYATNLTPRWYKMATGMISRVAIQPNFWEIVRIRQDEPERCRDGVLLKVGKLAPEMNFAELIGKFDCDNLSLETTYEVVYEVKLEEARSGFEMQTECRLTLPDGSVNKQGARLDDKPLNEWTQVVIGEFKTSFQNGTHIEFSMSFEWHGLISNGLSFNPENDAPFILF